MAEKDGAEFPRALEEEPELFEDMQEFYTGYGVLSGSRQIGMSVGPIPMSEIAAYVQLFGVSDVPFFVRVCRELDHVYMEHHAESLPKRPKGNPPPAGSGPATRPRRPIKRHGSRKS